LFFLLLLLYLCATTPTATTATPPTPTAYCYYTSSGTTPISTEGEEILVLLPISLQKEINREPPLSPGRHKQCDLMQMR